MKVIFSKAGKYKSGTEVVTISELDVKNSIEFDINDTNALVFEHAKLCKNVKNIAVKKKSETKKEPTKKAK